MTNEQKGQPGGPLAPALGSDIGVPDALRTRIKDLIRDAWKHGFDAEGPDAIGFIDEFALADEALDEYWPNEKLSDGWVNNQKT